MKIIFVAALLPFSLLLSQSFKVVPGRTTVLQRDSVQLWFRVLDEHGKPDPNLGRDQVKLTDNGVPIDQYSFSYGAPPAGEKTYIALVLDVSGSMRFGGKLEKLKKSARNFVGAMSADDYCAIVAFSSRPRLLAGFTNDKDFLAARIDTLHASGYTALYDALWEAIQQLDTQPSGSRKMILLITDGREEGTSLLGKQDIVGRIQTLNDLGIHVFDMNRSGPVDDLRRIAVLGGGTYTYNPVPDSVFSVVDEFLSDFTKAYVISYVPLEQKDGSHDVFLEVIMRGLKQQIETSYTAVIARAWVPEGIAAITGIMAAVILGAVLISYVRKKRSFALIAHPRESYPRLQESMPFNIVDDGGDERTRALTLPEERDEEKTILIEHRRDKDNVLGVLSVTRSTGSEGIIEIDSAEVLFGRSAQCKAQFDDKDVSRLHAKLRLEREGFVLYDLGSANGTFVNGEEVQKRILRTGDQIGIGNNLVVFRAGEGQP